MNKGEPGNKKQAYNADNEDTVLFPAGDRLLLARINDYFKAYFDIEDVRSDPAYKNTDEYIKTLVSGFMKKGTGESEIQRFIRNSIPDDQRNDGLHPEISRIMQESDYKRIDGITAEWVRDWHERKRREPEAGNSEKEKEIRSFVIDSLQETDGAGDFNEVPQIRKEHKAVTRIFWWTGIAAAAVLAAFFLIKFLIPGGNPERLFSKYYEPYYAASVITRSSGQEEDENLRYALENYRLRNFRLAAVEFSKALLTASVPDMAEFYLGVTFIELNEYDRAFMILEPLSAQPGEFMKEAQWYLGLLSVRTGKKDKARECFELLAEDSGFYSGPARKILRLIR